MKIGHARVSTEDQNLDLQMDALNRAVHIAGSIPCAPGVRLAYVLEWY